MEQFNLVIPSDYAKRGKMYDYGRMAIFAALILILIQLWSYSIFDLRGLGELYREMPVVMNTINSLPYIVLGIAGVFFILGDKRFSIYGICLVVLGLLVIASPYIIQTRSIISFDNIHMGFFGITFLENSVILLGLLTLYQLFSQAGLNRRLALIVFLQILILGITACLYYTRHLNWNTYGHQVVERSMAMIGFASQAIETVFDILLIILFCKIGNSKKLVSNMGTDEGWTPATFFSDRLSAGAGAVVLFMLACFILIINFPID